MLDGAHSLITIIVSFPNHKIILWRCRGRPSPALMRILCRSLVRANEKILVWEVFMDEGILFPALDARQRAAKRVAGAFAVLDDRARFPVALRVVIIFRIGDGPERLVRRRDRDRIDEDTETEGGGVCTQWYAGVQH